MSTEDTLIIPPPKIIKAINAVAKTLSKKEFEENPAKRTMLEESLLTKGDTFQFVQEDNPFHAYYLKVISEEREGIKKEEKTQISQPIPVIQPVKAAQKILPPSFTNQKPPDIGAYQLDVIYLTAQYVAQYGKEFGAAIAIEQKDSELFSFMRPGQPYFRYFNSLVEQYRLALHPSHLLRKRLESEADSILNIKAAFDAEASAEKQRIEDRKKEAAEKKVKDPDEAYDWDNFEVVDVIEYEDSTIPDAQPQENVRIARSLPKPIMQKSPYTGEMIPVEQFGDHLKFERRHPQYQKELETMKERREQQHSALANGSQIAENLRLLVKDEAPKLDDSAVVWDGREETVAQTVAAQARKSQYEKEKPAKPELKKTAPVIGPTLPKRLQQS